MYFLETELKCFSNDKHTDSIAIELVLNENCSQWLKKQNDFVQNLAKTIDFGENNKIFKIPSEKTGELENVVYLIDNDMYSIADLANTLEAGNYHIQKSEIEDLKLYYIAFALGSYSFDKYRSKPKSKQVKLYLPEEYKLILPEVEATFLVRDMITTTAEDMGPEDIAKVVKDIAKKFDGQCSELVGQELVENDYMGVYTVGKGSHRPPRLVHLNWGDKKHPKISVVGKGVAFDTGGLNIKPGAGMMLMLKDMGGAANAIGLAYMIMKHKLPVNLSLVIPTVENAIDAKSYRPSDIITMKNGTTVQVTNTDAEGRLILAEPLYEEAKTNPDYLIDFTTLTGAARVAVGPEISALFCNDDETANELYKYSKCTQDKVWRLPLSDCYRKALKTDFADISHCDLSPFAGATKAALFLEYFVGLKKAPKWVHFDLMGWNVSSTAGKPKGGEMMAVRTTFAMLSDKYK
ncbi:M17 family metallopeptidase [Francisella adeliensis]|uniref:Leucyl aminopeptidase n=1 Tax=Francisella adeliensis TaxID=2007306 RepID=A0A2Z4XXH5_9GAMM|nr:leucyl aminopeptidase family protein [Francisella adeliensis]AXA33430.1 leucyl aminopeptidase [Francisella adeliensis]MBK2085449.1 leucyl aminopeptidase family protein [Francisella adeliensis]MBK2097179.1 leucyl aminopeptidase family protein [Francisella adeliensis]QIW11658.1 leucyl aminopeptidase family protein [Francisella adeliensis]QIW13533.1 leucyl aminopeptidase family protein [Francisella adeliensis]